MSERLPVLICGSKGRMGTTLIRLAKAENARIVAARDMGDALEEGIEGCRVAIDFSHHEASVRLADLCADKGIAMVIGTTGHSETQRDQILEHTRRIPIVWAGNYSIGVNLLFYLAERATTILGDRYQPEIIEVHHRHKKDAPSGTAINLAESIEATAAFKDASRSYGRHGETGERPNGEIGIHALRGGEVIGEHTVYLFGENDRIELTHRANDRAIFASGAYRAAHWVANQPPGLYSMRDVLGLKERS